MGSIEVSKTAGKAAKDCEEAIVTFSTIEDRDLVKAAGFQLAGQSGHGYTCPRPLARQPAYPEQYRIQHQDEE